MEILKNVFSLIFAMGKVVTLPLLAYFLFKLYVFLFHLERKKVLRFEQEKAKLLELKKLKEGSQMADNAALWQNLTAKYLDNSFAYQPSTTYPFSKWHRQIANTYDNIVFYGGVIRQAGISDGLVKNSIKLTEQAELVMQSLQRLSDIGRLGELDSTVDSSYAKLQAIQCRLISILESSGKEIESVIESIVISEHNDFDIRIEAIKANGTKTLQLLKSNPTLQEKAFYIEKILTVRLNELVEDYNEAKDSHTSYFDKNPDDIMDEALTSIEDIIRESNNEVLRLGHTESINKLMVNKRYFEEIHKQ